MTFTRKSASSVILALAASLLTAWRADGADLALTTGGRVSVELVFSDAAFSNTLSVVSPGVSIAATGCALQPSTGLAGTPILSEKLSQRGCRVELDSDPGTAGIQPFAAGTIFNFGLCAQTDADADCEFVWSSAPASNSDTFDHVTTTAIQPGSFPGQIFQLGWEDQVNGGDRDFNDLIALVRVNVDSDGDGLWDDWEQFGVDTNGDGTVDLDLPALGANRLHKDLFLEIDSMDCAVAGGDCAAGDTHNHTPKPAAIAAMVQAFANAPVFTNPDGGRGINLHVNISNTIVHQNFLDIPGLCGGTPLPTGIGNFDTVKADPANFGPTNPRRFVYHYQLFAHRRGPNTSSSGCSELPGNDTVISLGDWNTTCILPGPNGVLNTTAAGDDVTILGLTQMIFSGPNLVCNTAATGDDVQRVAQGNSPAADLDGDGLDDRTVGTVMQQAGTSMHELGHNLQLCHGGQLDPPSFTQCNMNLKPNYLSIMNYTFQMRGIPPTDPDGTGPLTARIDYSPMDLPDLVEANTPCPPQCGLNEPAGIGDGADNTLFFCPGGAAAVGAGTGAINWNCDGDSTDTMLSVDPNADGVLSVMAGFDDWNNLKYDFQNTGAFEDGAHIVVTTPVEIDFPTFLQLPEVAGVGFVPGGGNPASDCYLGFDVAGATSGAERRIECVEGDPCDAGVCGDGTCTFQLRMCVNQPGVSGCTPPAGGLAAVETPAPFRSGIPASLTGATCGPPLTLELKLKDNDSRANRRVVRPRATAPRGTRPRTDRDAFAFVCLPRTGPCGSPSGAFLISRPAPR